MTRPAQDGIVLLNKTDGFEKMNYLLHDIIKIGRVETELLKPFMEYGDRINRLTQQLHWPTKNLPMSNSYLFYSSVPCNKRLRNPFFLKGSSFYKKLF